MHLNEHITPQTGWRIERTAVRYTLADDWYKSLQRIFLITDYLRSREQMLFTPERICSTIFSVICLFDPGFLCAHRG